MSERPAPFPFLVGCGRSGTTLARALLDAHPAMAVPGESYFPVWLSRRHHRFEREGVFDPVRFGDELLADTWFGHWGLAEADVRSALGHSGVTSFADAVRQVYALYARHQAKSRYGDKTPTFVLHIDVLAALFPESVFVHIVRDGRAVALSLLEAAWGPDSLAQAALHWRHHVASGRRSGAALGPHRYIEVRYEDLVDRPEETAESLCRFIHLSYDQSMLRYFEGAPSLLRRLPDAYEHQNLRLPPTKGLRDWRFEMSAGDVELFEALAGDALSDFGYPRLTPRPALATRLRAGRERVTWRLDRAARRTRTLAARTLRR